MVSLRTDRMSCFSGDKITVEIWVCNDYDREFDDLNLHYFFEIDGRIYSAHRRPAQCPAMTSQFQGHFNIEVPSVNKRSELAVRAALVDKSGIVVEDNKTLMDVFEPCRNYNIGDIVVPKRQGTAERLIHALNLSDKIKYSLDFENSTILIDDLKIYSEFQEKIMNAVKKGSIVIFLNLPAGLHSIADSEIAVEHCTMGSRHFVSRNKQHPMAHEFESEDFKFWYDCQAGRISPFLKTSFESQDFVAILKTINKNEAGHWRETQAVGEKKTGHGAIRIAQLELVNQVADNPAAFKFAMCLLEKTGKHMD
jgi:hypothetical protein